MEKDLVEHSKHDIELGIKNEIDYLQKSESQSKIKLIENK